MLHLANVNKLIFLFLLLSCGLILSVNGQNDTAKTNKINVGLRTSSSVSYLNGNNNLGNWGVEILYRKDSIIKNAILDVEIEAGLGFELQTVFKNVSSYPFIINDALDENRWDFSLKYHYLTVPIRIINQIKLSETKPIALILSVAVTPSFLISGTAEYSYNVIEFNPNSQIIGTETAKIKSKWNSTNVNYFSPKFNIPVSVDIGLRYGRVDFGGFVRYYPKKIGHVWCMECGNKKIEYHLFNVGVFLSAII